MRVAIMQPYLFPYFPYFQLINAVDTFVLLDTVQFIRRGWMNRNRIRIGDQIYQFTIPVSPASRALKIDEVMLAQNAHNSADKLKETLRHQYAKTRHWDEVRAAIVPLLDRAQPGMPFVDYAELNLSSLCQHIGIKTPLVRASRLPSQKAEIPSDYIINICKELGASEYVNPVGGKHLYSKADFDKAGLTLRFLRSTVGAGAAPQADEDDVDLSVIHTIASLGAEAAADMLARFVFE